MKLFYTILTLIAAVSACRPQEGSASAERQVGGPCEGCEAIYEYGSAKLTPTDTLPTYGRDGRKIKLSGLVLKPDGHSPAKDVVLYVYHTNTKGIYETRGDEKGWAARHGFIRGWVKTGKDGRYNLYTIMPGSYPDSSEPAHIHVTVKEPGVTAYYIDSFLFDDDPLLTEKQRAGLENRGGGGILALKKDTGGLYLGERNIILGHNIPDYD